MSSSIFLSYSHVDEVWMRRAATHLRTIPKNLAVDIWSDTAIGVGEDWYSKITEAIGRSTAAVLLVSADFLTSDFITREEIPRLLEAEAERGLAIVPVLARPCAFGTVDWLAKRQLRPRGAAPLSAKPDHEVDAALTELVHEIATLETAARQRTMAASPALVAAPQTQELRATRSRVAQYFFYLARERIDSLFFQLPVETIAQSALDLNQQPALGARPIGASGSSAGFAALASHLFLLLDDIESHKRVGDLRLVIENKLAFNFDWYLVACKFKCVSWDAAAPQTLLEGDLLGYRVVVVCIKSNLLGLTNEGGQWIATSGSYYIFHGGQELALKGMLRVVALNREKKEIMTTPLYLTLDATLES